MVTKQQKRLLWIVALCAVSLLLLFSAPEPEHPEFAIRIAGFTTNAAGAVEVLAELHNRANDCTFETQLLIADGGEYRSTLLKGTRAFMTSYTDAGQVQYYYAANFVATNTAVRSSAGNRLRRGESAELRFVNPTESWRLAVTCERLQVSKRSLRATLAQLNAWANSKTGLPVIFYNREWSRIDFSTPVIPAKAIVSGQLPAHLAEPHLYRP